MGIWLIFKIFLILIFFKKLSFSEIQKRRSDTILSSFGLEHQKGDKKRLKSKENRG